MEADSEISLETEEVAEEVPRCRSSAMLEAIFRFTFSLYDHVTHLIAWCALLCTSADRTHVLPQVQVGVVWGRHLG